MLWILLQTVDEQLDRMNEAEFKAFLEACTNNKTKKTLEQAAMFSVSFGFGITYFLEDQKGIALVYEIRSESVRKNQSSFKELKTLISSCSERSIG